MGAGARVKSYLDDAGISQAQLAKAMGKSPQLVSMVLNENVDMPLSFALFVATTYGVSLDWVFLGRGLMFPEVGKVGETHDPYAAWPTRMLMRELERRFDDLEAKLENMADSA